MFSANKAVFGGLGPAITTILLMLDQRMGWGLGPEFWGAALTVAFTLLVFFVPNVTKQIPTSDTKSGDAS